MHAIAHGSCTDIVRESALKADSGRKIPCRTGIQPASVLRLAFQSDAITNWAILRPYFHSRLLFYAEIRVGDKKKNLAGTEKWCR